MDKKAFKGWQRQAIREHLAKLDAPLLTTKAIQSLLDAKSQIRKGKPQESPRRHQFGESMVGWFSKSIVAMTIRCRNGSFDGSHEGGVGDPNWKMQSKS